MVFVEPVPVAGRGRDRRVRRSVLLSLTAALAVTVTGCSSSGHASTPSASGSSASSVVATTPAPVKVPTVAVATTTGLLSYLKPVRIVVSNGSFTSMQVNLKKGDQVLEGTVSGDGRSWISETPPKPSSAYTATARVTDSAGQIQTTTVAFKVAKVPDSQRVAFNVTPASGSTVGIGQPVVVRFLTPISKRAAIEKVMTVSAKTSSGSAVVGSWHWLNSQEVHWRPKTFWVPGTKVTVDMKIAGVKAGPNRYGRQDYSQSFRIGASHVTRVDGSSHRVKVYRDGKLINNWPTGTGRRGLETYSGTYIVLGKSQVVEMDSCSARITCDKKDPDYYNEKEYWATRVTASGTFLHAAGWDGLLGRANVSHGCIHLSDADAKIFYGHAVVGDVVIVNHTGRGPQQRIATQDPGLYDWNLSWATWKAGSAIT